MESCIWYLNLTKWERLAIVVIENPNVTTPGVFIETPGVATGMPGVYTANLYLTINWLLINN